MSNLQIPIIFENSDFIVIDKPGGLTVNNAESTKGQETVQNWCSQNPVIASECEAIISKIAVSSAGGRDPRNDNEREFAEKAGIVHRLDKDTSGLLVIAKNLESYLNLKSQFQDRTVVKKYLALVHGVVRPEVGEINAPIDRNPFNRTHFGVFPGGREASTSYKVLKVYKDKSLLEITPKTGRTHQIRVHMKWINHPIVGDPLYGGRKNYQADQKFCPRLFLHASHLEILGFKFDSPLPSELKKVLE